MDLKTKIFDQVAAARTGQKTVNEATESILDLFSVVGRSEQYHCELFDFGRCEQRCDKQCDSCYWMESKQ